MEIGGDGRAAPDGGPAPGVACAAGEISLPSEQARKVSGRGAGAADGGRQPHKDSELDEADVDLVLLTSAHTSSKGVCAMSAFLERAVVLAAAVLASADVIIRWLRQRSRA